MINKKGFTLMETIAVVVILGVIAMTAIPNIVGTIEKSKKRTYRNDASRMIARAKSIFKSDTTIEEPEYNECVLYTLSDLKINSLDTGPNKGKYLEDYSFVIMKNDDSYKVQLLEEYKSGGKVLYRGITYQEEGSNLTVTQGKTNTSGFLSIETSSLSECGGSLKTKPIRP